ncbi:MAG: redoxin domain-containing protein [Ferruginibacter sp.]
MQIKLGQKAPDFTLYDSAKKKVILSSFEGTKNVLLLFFPLAFTSTCTTELCIIRDDMPGYQNDNLQVLGISVDSVYTLAKYAEEQRYSFPLLSDFNKDVSQLYGSFYTLFGSMDMSGVGKRSAFIIDKSGIIKYAEVLENAAEIPDFAAIDLILKSL